MTIKVKHENKSETKQKLKVKQVKRPKLSAKITKKKKKIESHKLLNQLADLKQVA